MLSRFVITAAAFATFLGATCSWAQLSVPAGRAVSFAKQTLTDRYYCDGVTTGDFNRDGKPDIVAGPFWYEGPTFEQRHEFYPAVALPPEKSPSNSMFSYVWDFNGDGWDDILVLGRVHLHEAYWYENPAARAQGPLVSPAAQWRKHFVFERIRGESPPFADVDGDGRPELVCHWEDRWGLLKFDPRAPEKPWRFVPISQPEQLEQFYHGTGIGDVNRDRRLDLITNDGWWEQPPDWQSGAWQKHTFRFATRGGAQMFADDVDGDGDADLITSLDAHGWGLAWFEQVEQDGQQTFREHKIMGDRSEEAKYGVAFTQPHALALADMDGDGLKDIVVGKRRWAHGPKGDIEPSAAPVLYWFRLGRQAGHSPRYEPQLIDSQSGVGVQITVADLNRDNKPDILTASKLGTFVFSQAE
ncbi:MAG: VCBS repeat-containing protein [Pirellulales bacterium]